jgi:SH3 domain protein
MKIELATKCRALFMVLIVLSVSFGTAPAIAETRYVSDLLIVSLREGQADDSPIIGYIRSDTPVDVIEENESFAYIKTPDNLTGWVKNKFLVSEKPKAILIEELKHRINDLEDKIILLQQNPETGGQPNLTAEFSSKIDALQEDIKNEKRMAAKLENELKQATEKYNNLVEQSKQRPDAEKELQALKEKNQGLVVELTQANKKYSDLEEQSKQNPDVNEEVLALKDKNQELITQLRHTKQEMQPSFFSGNIKWFLTGAGVLLLGFIIGRSLRRKRTYRY